MCVSDNFYESTVLFLLHLAPCGQPTFILLHSSSFSILSLFYYEHKKIKPWSQKNLLYEANIYKHKVFYKRFARHMHVGKCNNYTIILLCMSLFYTCVEMLYRNQNFWNEDSSTYYKMCLKHIQDIVIVIYMYQTSRSGVTGWIDYKLMNF